MSRHWSIMGAFVPRQTSNLQQQIPKLRKSILNSSEDTLIRHVCSYTINSTCCNYLRPCTRITLLMRKLGRNQCFCSMKRRKLNGCLVQHLDHRLVLNTALWRRGRQSALQIHQQLERGWGRQVFCTDGRRSHHWSLIAWDKRIPWKSSLRYNLELKKWNNLGSFLLY